MRRYQLELFADYSQIWLEDRPSLEPNPSFIFSDRHLSDRVWTCPHMLIMFTARNYTVPVRVEIGQTRPEIDDAANWDHIVEASLDVISSSFSLSGLNDTVELIYHGYPNTTYRVRMYHANLGTIDTEGGLEGDDHYKISVWPDTFIQPTVLKRWTEPV